MNKKLHPDILAKAKQITGRRARVVVDHILKHGSITTEDLKSIYGYDHPPRAIKDVTDQGLPLEREFVRNSNGRRMASYSFGDPASVKNGRIGGRVAFSKSFKAELIEYYGCRCAVCNAELESRYLQIDHRIPYDLGGEPDGQRKEAFMLLCSSCNRAKSWSCEHCENFLVDQDPQTCQTCYWANPLEYSHVATENVRRVELVWQGTETKQHDLIAHQAGKMGVSVQKLLKTLLGKFFGPKAD